MDESKTVPIIDAAAAAPPTLAPTTLAAPTLAAPTPAQITLSKDTVKRLIKDVREIIKNPLTSHGIHYHHNKDDILCGQAMIIGPKDTPYEQGYYFFDFKFPVDYPHKPPVVTYHTNDGLTRFNPNLYKSGKVCLSILNTWKGDQWTGCQSITSILLALCTLLNDKPLLNEPGINETHYDFHKYNKIIEFMNFKVAMIQTIKNDYIKNHFFELYEIMIDDFLKNFNKIIDLINKKKSKREAISTYVYKMYISIDYETLMKDIDSLYTMLHNSKKT